jgi:hypothetical protein
MGSIGGSGGHEARAFKADCPACRPAGVYQIQGHGSRDN